MDHYVSDHKSAFVLFLLCSLDVFLHFCEHSKSMFCKAAKCVIMLNRSANYRVKSKWMLKQGLPLVSQGKHLEFC